jgi:hypothetical protein
MNRGSTKGLVVFLIVLALLAGCSQATPTPVPAPELSEDYEDALSHRNQLLLGTIRLEGTDLALTVDQARTLLPLWQGVQSLARSGTSSELEMDALMDQIEAAYSASQMGAIYAMRLTRADLNEDAAELGIAIGGTGNGTSMAEGGGEGAHLSEAERATRQAERQASGGTGSGSGSGGAGAAGALVDHMIQLLAKRVG